MSELREFECRIYWPVEQGVDETDDIDLFYLKSEADKVIADLKEQIEVLKNQACKMDCMTVRLYNEVCDDNIHQKYKRCLAMAMGCRESLRLMRTYEVTEDFWNLEPGQDAEYFCKKGDFYSKWRKRWLELAEKFKPNN